MSFEVSNLKNDYLLIFKKTNEKKLDCVIIMKKMWEENLTANTKIRRKMMTFYFYKLKSRNQTLKRKRGSKKTN